MRLVSYDRAVPQNRPPIPRPLKRQILLEAGHRCAIPTCRQHPVQIDHIDDWAKVKQHRPENLIALCGTCHDRKTKGDIDRQSLLQYKANLQLLTSRYSRYELRLLEHLTQLGDVAVGGDRDIDVREMIRDGLIQVVDEDWSGTAMQDFPTSRTFRITEAGATVVASFLAGEPVQATPAADSEDEYADEWP